MEETVCKTVQVSLSALLKQKGLAVCNVSKDGYCSLSSCAIVFDKSVEDLVTIMSKELNDNISNYRPFLNNSDDAFLRDFEAYVKRGVYDTDTGDLFLTALSNALDVCIIAYEDRHTYVLETSIRPASSKTPFCEQRLGYLLRSGNEKKNIPWHFDALIRKRSTSNETEARSNKFAEKHQQCKIGETDKGHP